MAETAHTTETWLYAGQRLNAKGGILHAWHDGHDIVHYAKVKAFAIGHAYAVDVNRNGDGLTVYGSPRYLAEQADREATQAQLDTWRAEDRATKAIVEGKQAEKAAAADDDLERALEVIRRHYARLRTMQKRGAFQSYVLGEMTRPPKQDRDGD